MNAPVPYIIYWLIVKDFLYDLDLCETSNDTGYCLPDFQCSNIANGTNIGSCDTDASGSVCCKITMTYFNETYTLSRFFVRKSQTETAIEMRLFNRQDIVFYQPHIHVCVTPDRIFWPIMAYYSRESRDLDKQSSGEKHLYAVTLEKMENDKNTKNLISECLSKSKVSAEAESAQGDELYLYFNKEVVFPIRKFFTPEMQKMGNVDSTDNIKSLFEALYSDKRKRRSLNLSVCKENLKCESEHLDIDSVEEKDDIYDTSTQTEISHHIHDEEKLVHHVNMNSPFEPKLDSEKLIKGKNSPSRKEQYKAIHDRLFHNEQFHDSNKASHILEKLMHDEAAHNLDKLVQMEVIHDMRKPVQTDVTHDMRRAVKIEATHDLRKPVQIEATYDMRKPVALDESHDLRWPVIEEETTDLRTVKIDVYQNVFPESKFRNAVLTYIKESGRISRFDDNKNEFKILQNFLLNCKMNIFRNKTSDMENPPIEETLNDVWKEASAVCGRIDIDTASSQKNSKWPWMVSLLENDAGKYTHRCSGALLNRMWVITVAHCVNKKSKSDLLLVLGSHNSEPGKESRMEIEEIIMHPKFHRGMLENDIALLRLKTAIDLSSNIGPICLPWNIGELKYGTPVFLSWMLTKKTISENLEKVNVPIINNYECGVLYSTGKRKESIIDSFLCAGKNQENCDSESGSSLIAPNREGRWSLIGLVSWGSMCSNLKEPGVYARISSYMHWIKDIIDCYESFM